MFCKFLFKKTSLCFVFVCAFTGCEPTSNQATSKSGSPAMEKLIQLIHALSFLSIINVDILLPSGNSAVCPDEIEEN